MYLETERLLIQDLEESMAEAVHRYSLDADNRRFVPDEVFETEAEARSALRHLISSYQNPQGPFVYALLLKGGPQIGHIQLVKIKEGWEVGFHTARPFRGQGYATEAVRTFLPHMMDRLDLDIVYGICHADNLASRRVLEKAGFSLLGQGQGLYLGQSQRICKYGFTSK